MSKYKWVCPHLDGFPGICFVSDRKQGVLLPAELVQMMWDWKETDAGDDTIIAGIIADWMRDNWSLLKALNKRPEKEEYLTRLVEFFDRWFKNYETAMSTVLA
jgi:hypothetical protein